MSKDLEALRKIAEAATPGPWVIDSLESGEHGVFVEEGNPDYRKLGCASAIVASHLVGKNAEYLEAFDPETVLALLSRLERAERDAERAKAECARQKQQKGILFRRATEAEQAVQRVREVATAMANHDLPEAPRGGAWETANGAQLFAKDILEALDGEPNA